MDFKNKTKSSIAYDTLSQDEGDEVYSGEDVEAEPKTTKETWSSMLHNVAVVIIFVCTIIDGCIVFGILSGRFNLDSSSSKPLAELEIRSPYVNLDKLYKNASFPRTQHERIINHSRAFYQVSSSKPNTVMPSHLDIRLSNIGMAPIYQRRLLVDSSTSTIVQFRVIDFGMENCSLAVTIPPRNETTAILSGFEGPPTIEIRSLPAMSKGLDYKQLTWANKPKGSVLFYALPVDYGTTIETPKFHCPSMSYQTFEVTCSSPHCHVDLMGVGKGSSGLHMWQYQSI